MKKKKLLKEVERLNLKIIKNYSELKETKDKSLTDKLEFVKTILETIEGRFEYGVEIKIDDFHPDTILQREITFKLIL